MVNARIYFLGTGAAMPVTRYLPCIALKVNSDIYLLDPGEGCQVKMFKTGLSPVKVKAVFVTHAHGDHYLGLPGLIQTMTLSDRKEPLLIAGPKQFIDALLSIFNQGLVKPGFKVDLSLVTSNYTYSDNKISVRAFPVEHSLEAYGYHVTIGKKTICYTGDTTPSKSTVEACRGVDVLIHEATFTSIYEGEAHTQRHSTCRDAALIAEEAGVGLLVLFHISARHGDMDAYYDAVRVFKKVVVARDGMVIYL
jgi:ribonuclease Z